MIKFGHTADCHISVKYLEESVKSLKFICETAIKEGCEFLLIAGDLWDSIVNLTKHSPLLSVIEILGNASKVLPILIIYGNHDRQGSLEIFKEINANIYISDKIELLGFSKTKGIDRYDAFETKPDVTFFSVPFQYPEKIVINEPEYIQNMYDIDFTDIYIRKKLKALAKTIEGDPYRIVVCHGSMQGYVLNDGQEKTNLGSSQYHFTEKTFEEIDADYVAMGHIHKFQSHWMKGRACYPSSTHSVNLSETDEKTFSIITLDDKKFINKRVHLPVKKVGTMEVSVIDKNLRNSQRIIKETYTELNSKENSIWKLRIIGPKRNIFSLKDEIVNNDKVTIEYITTDNEFKNETNILQLETRSEKIEKFLEEKKIPLDNRLKKIFEQIEKEYAELEIKEEDS